MDEYESLSHTKYECIYHVVFAPKGRRRTLFEALRKHLGEVFRRLAEQKERGLLIHLATVRLGQIFLG